MSNIYKIQRYLSFIPGVSTLFIMVYTMIDLKKHKAGTKGWTLFGVVFFSSGILGFVINEFVMTGLFPLLNFAVSWVISIVANNLFVDLQIKCAKEHEKREKTERPDLGRKENAKQMQHKPQKGLIVAVAIIFLLVFSIIFCLTQIIPNLKAHKRKTIADTNGTENFSLNTITQAQILDDASEFTMTAFGENCDGNQSLVLDTSLKEQDYDKVFLSANEFSGVKVLQATVTETELLTLSIDSEVTSGNFVIVIVVDGQHYCDVAINRFEQITLEHIKGKTVLVKIAGETAKIKISVERSF